MSNFKTPGVYIKEQDAFTSSVVAVPTAVPAFIGYTERANRGKNSLLNKPTRITSLAEYMELFGKGPNTIYDISEEGSTYNLGVQPKTKFFMFDSIRMFYANGGGPAYIVSVGGYDYKAGVDPEDLNSPGKGLPTLVKEQEPTMVVIPDAVLLEEADCYSIYQAVLTHCGARMRSRIGLFDVYNGFQERNEDGNHVIDNFRNGIGNNHMQWGATYYPWVHTTITSPSEMDYRNIGNRATLIDMIKKEQESMIFGEGGAPKEAEDPNAVNLSKALSLINTINDDNLDKVVKELQKLDKGFTKGKDASADKAKEALTKKANDVFKPSAAAASAAEEDPRVAKYNAILAEIAKLENDDNHKSTAQTISAISPVYVDVVKSLREKQNLLPPSGTMAGIIALVDSQEGVHKAPANISLNSVTHPAVNLTSEEQENLNLPLSGKAINAIRSFVGKGVLVWGARSMDGNSQDWRYINVRRTMIMIEQSIKNSVEAYVFENNNAQTWIKVKTSIDNFLTEVWKAGSLAGATPSEAFEVNVGLGNTMTPVDILEGVMRISVKVAITRPAEFIEITFQQKMQES